LLVPTQSEYFDTYFNGKRQKMQQKTDVLQK